MAEQERGLCEGQNFTELPQFLKINRISLAFSLTSNKDQTCMNKSCFVFLLYRIICRFYAIFGHFGGHGRVLPLGSAFEGYGHGSPPPVNASMSIPTIDLVGFFRLVHQARGPPFSAHGAP